MEFPLVVAKRRHGIKAAPHSCPSEFSFLGKIPYNRKAKLFIQTHYPAMIKIRLKRYGKKREVSYRIVAMDSRVRRDGRPLEELGFYNPRTDETRLNVPAIVERLKQGAQPTETVRDILTKAQVFEQLKTA